MSLCLSTSAVTGSLNDKLNAISAAGFSHVDITAQDLANFDGNPVDLVRMLEHNGLHCNAL